MSPLDASFVRLYDLLAVTSLSAARLARNYGFDPAPHIAQADEAYAEARKIAAASRFHPLMLVKIRMKRADRSN